MECAFRYVDSNGRRAKRLHPTDVAFWVYRSSPGTHHVYVMHKQEYCGGVPDALCHEAESVLAARPSDELILSEHARVQSWKVAGYREMVHFLGVVDLLNPKFVSLKHLSLAARIRHSNLVKVMLWDPRETSRLSQCRCAAQRTAIPALEGRSAITAANGLQKRLGSCQRLILAVIP